MIRITLNLHRNTQTQPAHLTDRSLAVSPTQHTWKTITKWHCAYLYETKFNKNNSDIYMEESGHNKEASHILQSYNVKRSTGGNRLGRRDRSDPWSQTDKQPT